MKKKIVLLMLSMTLAIGLAGCGSASSESVTSSGADTSASSESAETEAGESVTEEDTSSSSEEEETYSSEIQRQILTAEVTDEEDLANCMELGEYKGISLTKTVEAVTDDAVDSYIESLVEAVEVDDENATVEEGDTVDIAFVGKMDGEEFDGGSSDSYDLVIGSDTFIDGFEDGLIGMKTGETKDLNLTFPDDYGDYSGMDVVFTVTINAIKRTPEVDDAWVEEYTGGEYTTLEEYQIYVRETLEEENEETAESSLQADAWSAVEENCTFLAIPQSYYDSGTEDFDANVEAAAANYGLTVDEYIEQAGVDEDSYNEQRDQYARYTAASKMMLDLLIEAEGITTDSEEYQTELQEVADLYGVSAEELEEENGEDTVYEYVMTQVVIARIISYAEVETVTE